MNSLSSSYYPKRAKWHRHFLYLWLDLKRTLHLEALHFPSELSARDFLLGLICPGHAFSALGKKLYGRWLKRLYGLASVVFLVALGHSTGNLAFGLMVSIHTISILFLLDGWWRGMNWVARCGLALLTLASLGQLTYRPLVRQMAKHVAVPLTIGDRIIVVNPRARPSHVRVGDTVVYAMEEQNRGGLHLESGFGMETVLAQSGDHIRFGPEGVEIDGRVSPRQTYMPVSGEMIVPEKHWLIWPHLNVSGGHGGENISVAMLQVAVVSERQFTGRPYTRWFWTKQTLP